MQRLGTYRSWQTEKSLAKAEASILTNHAAFWDKELRALACYAEGGNCFPEPGGQGFADPPLAIDVAMSLLYVNRDFFRATWLMFSRREGWQEPLRKTYGHLYWHTRIIHRAGSTPSLGSAVRQLIGCLYQGWFEQAESLALEILLLYGRRRYYDVNGEFSQPLYHWFLCVCFDHYGWSFDGWGRGVHGDPKCDIHEGIECFSEPVLNELFAHWRDEDLSPMAEHLLWLCDYYTHRTRRADGTEFGNDLLHTRFPELILAWFRLRELRGLPIPRIEHPLMQPPYLFLPPPQPFYTDDLLERVLARLRREELPGLGDMPQPPDFTPAAEPPSWWRRLFGTPPRPE